MNKTIIYLIRHAETIDEDRIRNTDETAQEINEIFDKYEGKRIAIISHGGAIKFYLLSYCEVNENLNLEYKGKEYKLAMLIKNDFYKK